MRVGIMQPYFLPYVGYFQLINSVDSFVVYDDIKYTKKGWINRNRILDNKGEVTLISLPLKKDSDSLTIIKRSLSDDFDKHKLLRKIEAFYKGAPNFKDAFQLVTGIIEFSATNLFEFIFNSIKEVCNYLKINTRLIVSSTINRGQNLKGVEMVKDICLRLNASEYINPIGGIDLYDKEDFLQSNLKLNFLNPVETTYVQNCEHFEPWLSILDVIMMNDVSEVKKMIANSYTLI
ncbi:MAG: hypothetical protein E6Q37_03025 [Crocinitomicaceae bacterium]|nr:MAG: hypothetical protein E6Q37_03025 [Crocinitomicaceae bacterium]